MISFKAYRSLSIEKQAQILWEDGVYLELIRHTSKLNIELYALNDFYVEIYFDKSTEEPQSLKPFKKLKGLEPYLSLINIQSALEIRNDGSWK